MLDEKTLKKIKDLGRQKYRNPGDQQAKKEYDDLINSLSEQEKEELGSAETSYRMLVL